MWNFGLHYLFTWTPDDNWIHGTRASETSRDSVPRVNGPIQGSEAVLGAEVRFTAASTATATSATRISTARNVNALGESLEAAHQGRSQLQQRISVRRTPRTTVFTAAPERERLINSVDFQYSCSFGAYARAPEDWWATVRTWS